MDEYNKLLNTLKSKYQYAYLALATKEELAEFIRLYVATSHLSEIEVKAQIKKIVEIQKVNLVYKPYLEYRNSLESRLGVYYFVKLNSNERDKLINLYTKYMQTKVKGYTKDLAFMDLFQEAKAKYEQIRLEVDTNLHNLNNMLVGKQIGIDELLKK